MNFAPSFMELDSQDYPVEGYKKNQIREWIYKKGVRSFDEMTNLSSDLRKELSAKWRVGTIVSATRAESEDGSMKFLFTLEDGKKTEAVYMPYEDHVTMCISSMVGCPMDCKFCATGNMGYDRNLTAAEIIDQILYVAHALKIEPVKIRNIVFMGMGEPLLNFDNVVQAIDRMIDEKYLNMSSRRITLSTVGIPSQIKKLADTDCPVKLALSLHAPNDDVRRQIIPSAKFQALPDIMDAVRYYYSKTKRRITFEYTMLKDVNDSIKHARQIIDHTKDMTTHVNLIPFNAWDGAPFERPDKKVIEDFAKILRDAKIDTTVRFSRGQDSAAACGQLALKNEGK